ncbi:DUF2236 domain-containing protein [Streptomyces sp. ISL-98]|uniref:oxygenase MpaB family protein n=1 Tax=Streptomyces sp. ISL-98 TaxID=2819192 RepID=UPI001BE83967|nr:oxygenase MpaB family protein [Streptomyces sp. ISL-98]MBT2509250.1 DUF2236 domain-containing protein [Streptomyces sp. ISL-98]
MDTAQPAFPRDAAIRTIATEPAVYLGAGRALLLQLAHPQIAKAVDEHSHFQDAPLARLVGTLKFLGVAIFGSRAEAEQAAARVRRIHDSVAGDGYSANDPALQTWVNATLIDSALHCYTRAFGHISYDMAQAYYREAMQLSELLGTPRDKQPPDYFAFRLYVAEMLTDLQVSPAGKRLGNALLSGARLPEPLHLAMPVFRQVTIGLLPAPIREQYGLRWTTGQDRLLRITMRGGGVALAAIPGPLRRSVSSAGLFLVRHRMPADESVEVRNA